MRRFQWLLLAGSVLLVYALAELLVAPRLHRQFGFFEKAYFPLDVDHRLEPGDPALPTNSDGVRSPFQSRYYSPDSFNIVFLGDSFVFGQRLDYQDTIPLRLERRLRAAHPACDVKVVNFGWVSASPILSERILRRLGPRYHPDLVALGIDMTDFWDDLRYARMLERPDAYRLLSRLPIATTALREFAPGLLGSVLDRWTGMPLPADRFFVVNRPLEESRALTTRLLQSLRRIDAASRELGARFVAFVFPRNFQYDPDESPGSWERGEYSAQSPYKLEPFRFFEELRGELEFPVHSLLDAFVETDVFPTCFANDPHWNRDGAEVAARAIAERLDAELARAPCGAPVEAAGP